MLQNCTYFKTLILQDFFYFCLIIGVSLSEPHTSVTALQDACVCPVRVAIYQKF